MYDTTLGSWFGCARLKLGYHVVMFYSVCIYSEEESIYGNVTKTDSR